MVVTDPTNEELQELAEDLAELDVQLPEPEPAVPSMHEDCVDPDIPTGYSLRPKDSWVHSLSRDKYTQEEAEIKLEQLALENNWALVDDFFWTIDRWCWRVYAQNRKVPT